jgi:hypothetical protein
MQKVICIDEGTHINITKGNLYTLDTIYGETDKLYWIRDNYDHLRGIRKNLFITLEEYRDNKINIILYGLDQR